MEWALAGGKTINYFSPIANQSFQSILGQAPYYQPTARYYGLLMAAMVNDYSPYIIRPTVTSGTSSKIRVYYLDYHSHYGVLIINKDTSPTASGFVDVTMSDQTGLHCIYTSAPNLTSTSNINFAGYHFVPNVSRPQGFVYGEPVNASSNGIYSVPVNYSSMAFCRTIEAPEGYKFFPRFSESGASWMHIAVLLLLLLLLQ